MYKNKRMELRICDKGKCGIYKIINTINHKIYVGKAIDIYQRMLTHRNNLRRKSKDENRHLIGAWHKYGEDAFTYEIIEELDINDTLLREREDYWIVQLNATDQNLGYNLRRDSSTGCIVSEETRKLHSENNKGSKNPNFGNYWTSEQKEKMSKLKQEQYRLGIAKVNMNAIKKGILNRNINWENNPELKDKMKEKVSKAETKYHFYQYNKKTGELIREWNSIYDILKEHPDWKRHNLYAACSGEKPSMYGYKWKKVLKEDIVQQ